LAEGEDKRELIVVTGVRPKWSAGDYVWFILHNLIGWILILASGPIGMLIPGPGGLPMFLIGFALITFPGKRHLTARVMRGVPVDPDSRGYQWLVASIALLAPAGLISWLAWFMGRKNWIWLDKDYWVGIWKYAPIPVLVFICYVGMVTLIFLFGIRGVRIINLGLALSAKARRKARPWMRRKGLDLLPPRRRARLRRRGIEVDHNILEIDQRHRDRIRQWWNRSKPWIMRLLRVAVVVAIFSWMIKPIVIHWKDVKGPIAQIDWWQFFVAALMFSAFLFVFRALAWRRIIAGFGHELPVSTSTRIWSMSELARYLPGGVWQFAGRVILCKPYGISAPVCSASQLLELGVFMLANILVGLTCILAAGFRRIPANDRHWLYIALAFIPVLLTLIHPKVFYGLLNKLLTRFRKDPVEQALKKRELSGVLLWNILGLLWQSLAIWLLTHSVLGLPIGKWYVLAGAYCLAWTIGFSVGFMSPGGMGVREAVFVLMLRFLLPQQWVTDHLDAHLADPNVYKAFLMFLGILLRLWAICGELVFASLAYFSDRGRVKPELTEPTGGVTPAAAAK
jgi:glycosyltransferase 2 family protein